jgi:glycogen operon protein
VYLDGDAINEVDARGQRVVDESFLVLFNAHHDPIPFTLPEFGGTGWLVLLDTAREDDSLPAGSYQPGDRYPLEGRSLSLLQQVLRR